MEEILLMAEATWLVGHLFPDEGHGKGHRKDHDDNDVSSLTVAVIHGLHDVHCYRDGGTDPLMAVEDNRAADPLCNCPLVPYGMNPLVVARDALDGTLFVAEDPW